MENDPLGLLDMAIEHRFEVIRPLSRGLRGDEALRYLVIEEAEANDLYIELDGLRIDRAVSGQSTEGW